MCGYIKQRVNVCTELEVLNRANIIGSIKMESLGFNIWGLFPPFHSQRRKRRNPSSKSDSSVESTGPAGFRFPIKQAATAGTLAVTGDTLAQLRENWVKNKSPEHQSKVTFFIPPF